MSKHTKVRNMSIDGVKRLMMGSTQSMLLIWYGEKRATRSNSIETEMLR